MADESPIIIPLEIDLNKTLKDLAALVAAGARAEDALESLLQTATKLGNKLNKLSGNIVINVSATSGDLDQIVKQVNAIDGESATVDVQVNDVGLQQVVGAVNSLDSISPDIDVTVSTDGKLEQAAVDANTLDSISPTIDVTVQDSDLTAAAGKVDKLDSAKPTIPVSVEDSDLTGAQRKIEKIDSSNPSVVIRTTEQLDSIIDKLDSIEKLSTIQLVISTAGVIQKLDEVALAIPGAGTILEMNEAMRTFEAQTGKSGKVYEDAIGGVFEQNWGDSQADVAEVAAKLTQAGVAAEDLQVATTATFEAMSVTGYDAEKTIDAQVKLVKNGLVPGYKEASDLIVTGFQQGGDAAGDFLDTITEYSSHFSAMGIDGPTALNLITQSLQAGTRDSDKLADSFKELNLLLVAATGDVPSGSAVEPLQRLGLMDEAQAVVAGTMTGTSFADAAVKAIETSGSKADYASIFGTPIEDFGVNIFKNLDFKGAEGFQIDSGAATDAAATLSDTWGSSIEALKRTIETDLADSFKIAGQPLSDILDGAKDKVQELTALLQSGKGLPEALEIVLQAPGLAAEIQRFEASIGNFILDLMSAIASAQEALGIGDKGANLKQQVKAGAEAQFAYDIKVANPEEIQDVVARAVSRGVDTADIATGFTTATGELIAQGDVDRAQELLYTVNEMPNAFIQAQQVGGKGMVNLPLKIDPNATADQIQTAIDQAKAAYAEQSGTAIQYTLGDVQFTPTVDTTAAHAAIDETLTLIDAGMQNLQKPVDLLAAPFQAIQAAIQTPGAQQMASDAYTGSAIQQGKEATQGGIDWSDPANAILPPAVVDQTSEAVDTIVAKSDEMTTSVTGNLATMGSSAADLLGGKVVQSASDANLEFARVVVGTDDLMTNGGARLDAFAANGVEKAGTLANAWSAVAGAIASTGAAIPTVPGSTATPYGPSLPPDTSALAHGATGGEFKAGVPMVVGEEGEELFVPPSDGTLIDADTTSLIMQALDLVKNSSGQVVNNSTTTNYNLGGLNNNFNVPHQAAGVSASSVIARQIRSLRS